VKKVLIFPNPQKEQTLNITQGIYEYLSQHGVKVFVIDNEKFPTIPPLQNNDIDKIDLVITLGGDGTILRFVQTYPNICSPIIGINMGSLGFLADISINDIYPALGELLNNNYQIQNRLMLEGFKTGDSPLSAINEIVIHRASNHCLIDLVLHVDGLYLNTFSADGIIISTPSGSTAYSLAAGGPILSPELQAVVITPISPHTISNRPIVLAPVTEIQVQYISPYQPVEVTFDGHQNRQIQQGDVFRVKKSTRSFQLVKLPQQDFFLTLRQKLGWTGKLKP
jgi:NAD+ kinase